MRHKHADVLIAYANDTTVKVQYWSEIRVEWIDAYSPSFHPSMEWRIKPEPKKAYVFMYKKGIGRWIPMSYDAEKDAQNYYEELLKFGYAVTDIKEVEWK